jgi:hypothetical protein
MVRAASATVAEAGSLWTRLLITLRIGCVMAPDSSVHPGLQQPRKRPVIHFVDLNGIEFGMLQAIGEVNWLVADAMRMEVPIPVIAQCMMQLFASRERGRAQEISPEPPRPEARLSP